MAKKSKVPRPPVQAPKRRTDSRNTWASGVPRWAWVVGAAVVAAIVVGVAVAVSGGGGGSGSGSGSSNSNAALAKTMAAAGCTYRTVAPLPPKKNATNYHEDVPTLTAPTKGLWSTFPPSAGGHYGAWAIWGFYRAPVNPRQVVHNEEHGGVIIWWGPGVPSSTVDKLEAFYNEKADGMLGTPIAGLGSKIALTAWTGDPAKYYRNGDYGQGHIAVCKGFDEKAFAAFRDAFLGNGPEGIPISSDAPGTGPQ